MPYIIPAMASCRLEQTFAVTAAAAAAVNASVVQTYLPPATGDSREHVCQAKDRYALTSGGCVRFGSVPCRYAVGAEQLLDNK